MAVGKTTIGRMLSEALQLPFYDSDAEIEARAGAEISWIFDMEGEEGFRDREESIIDELKRFLPYTNIIVIESWMRYVVYWNAF